MKSPKYVVFVFVVVGLILTSGCDLLKKSQGSVKKQSAIKEESSAIETAKMEDFGCFYSCDFFPEGYPKQMCEDWKAGKQIYWPDDCSVMQYEPCIRLCEYEKNSTKKTTLIPSDMPSYDINFPQSPADFLFHTQNPVCVGRDDYHAQLVYARPSDGKDRYQEISKTLKKWIANANGIVNNEAKKFGVIADIKIACKDKDITVLNVILPKSARKYNTGDGKTTAVLESDLQELGYGDSMTKYIVYYDGSADGCEGGKSECEAQATPQKGPDDRLSADNIYNIGPSYAVLYDGGISKIPQKYHTEVDMLAPIIMLHEYTHTMGAVQLNSPNSAGEYHCKDEPPLDKQGSDVMCKSDNPNTVFGDACQDKGFEMHFDCNNDDYFNPKPDSGSYLATHWNLGSNLNRYIKFG